MKSSKKTLAKNRIIKKLDDLARKAVFERDGYRCIRCGRSGHDWKIDWAHVFSRECKATKWEPENAMTLCFVCHRWWHDYPTLSGEWFRKNWPERHERMLAAYNRGGKVNLQELLDGWKNL